MIKNTTLFILFVITCIIAYWWYYLVWNFIDTKPILEIHSLNVGQGDATLIETPKGKQILIDAGRGIRVLDPLGEILGPLDKSIDVAILTHPDADHIGGFVPIFHSYKIDYIIKSFIASDTKLYKQVEEIIDEEDIEVEIISSPKTFVLDGVRFDIIWPITKGIKDTNSASVVVLMTFGEIKALFMGDVSKSVENEIQKLFPEYIKDVEILKLGHHGSDTSTGESFLEHTNPDKIIISAGNNNSYNHPSPEVIDRIEIFMEDNRKSIDIYETKNGTISLCITLTKVSDCN